MHANVVHNLEQSDPPASVKSALRVLDLLEMLAVVPVQVGVSEIARRLGIPKSSTYMLLSTLESRGYVVGDESRRFCLNPAFGRGKGSWVGGARAALVLATAPVMQRLARLTGESSFLGVQRDEQTLEYIEKVVSSHEVRCDAELGQPRPLHSTSLGLVILAFRAQEQSDAYLKRSNLERLTDRTQTEPARLRRELAAIRKQGYAVTRDTNAVGASGVAVPVFMADGSVAALNISAPTSRFDAIVERATAELMEAAAALSRDLSGSAPMPGIAQPADERRVGTTATGRRAARGRTPNGRGGS